MPDVIQILPDSVANQIAAGEVVQRPASAVKELLENAIDAGATQIKVIVKDAGKTLIQIIDNGIGMSATDARMCFERHATSKIKKADDLFHIKTMGFRGEALASIAAIAQVELKTRLNTDEIGCKIEIEGSEVKLQEPSQTQQGTTISIKNLFYNIPARRNFLKTDSVELRHIIDEFQRVALAHPQVAFFLYSNQTEVFHLPPGNFKQRIVGVFGSAYNSRLVPVEENTPIVNIKGFVVKPEFSKKTRGEQFFFLNKRFIKSAYLNHAIQVAFEQLLPKDSFPSYFLFLEVNPKTIDVNIHPTKTEVKFEDERAIYTFLLSTVKKSLGQYNIAPTIDFNQEAHLYNMPLKPADGIYREPTIKIDPEYNPFNTVKTGNSEDLQRKQNNLQHWETLYKQQGGANEPLTYKQVIEQPETGEATQSFASELPGSPILNNETKQLYQLHNKYIVSPIKTGFIIVDQQAAHERVLFERIIEAMNNHKSHTQQELFPKTITFNAADATLVNELLPEIKAIGFDVSEFGKNTYIINGVPAQSIGFDTVQLLEVMLETYKCNLQQLKLSKTENIAGAMARSMCIKSGKVLSQPEMCNLLDELFACSNPHTSPSGKSTYITIYLDDLEKKFKK